MCVGVFFSLFQKLKHQSFDFNIKLFFVQQAAISGRSFSNNIRGHLLISCLVSMSLVKNIYLNFRLRSLEVECQNLVHKI